MDEKDWAARFEPTERERPSAPRFFSWPAFFAALIYLGLAILLLIGNSQNSDPEGLTAGWLIIAAPWIWTGFFGPYYWLAVPANALTLYIVLIWLRALFRTRA